MPHTRMLVYVDEIHIANYNMRQCFAYAVLHTLNAFTRIMLRVQYFDIAHMHGKVQVCEITSNLKLLLFNVLEFVVAVAVYS